MSGPVEPVERLYRVTIHYREPTYELRAGAKPDPYVVSYDLAASGEAEAEDLALAKVRHSITHSHVGWMPVILDMVAEPLPGSTAAAAVPRGRESPSAKPPAPAPGPLPPVTSPAGSASTFSRDSPPPARPYHLSYETLGALKVTISLDSGEQELSMLEAWNQLSAEGSPADKGGSPSPPLTVNDLSGPRFRLELLGAMLRLHELGADALGCTWFYYEADTWIGYPSPEVFRFFVCEGPRVVLESVQFGVESFEPNLLVEASSQLEGWASYEGQTEAYVRYCYRRFYTETLEGQLMVMDRSKPELFFFKRPRRKRPAFSAADVEQLRRLLTNFERHLSRLTTLAVAVVILLVLLLWRIR